MKKLLDIISNPKANDDELCDAAREITISQIKSEDMTKVLWERISKHSEHPWVLKELMIALTSTILVSDPLFPMVLDFMRRNLVSHSQDEEVRGSAAVSLGIFGDADSTEALIKVLEEELVTKHIGLMVSCVIALKMLKNPNSINILLKTLNLGSKTLTIQSAEALGTFGSLAKIALPSLKTLAVHGSDPEKNSALAAISSIERR